MGLQVLVAGGGLGGLAAAAALQRAGCGVRLFEQAREFSEVGAGIQLGPNGTRVLRGWGLEPALRGVASFPAHLEVRDAGDDRVLGRLALGERIAARYGAPYATVHRADLQSLLLAHAREAGVEIHTGWRAATLESGGPQDPRPNLHFIGGAQAAGDALVAADGVWSPLREKLLHDRAAQPSGHVAYRGLARQADLPAGQRSSDVRVWMGSGVHVVAYPVRGGELLNLVAIVETRARLRGGSWDNEGVAGELTFAAGTLSPALRALLDAMPHWRTWALHDRPPLRGPGEMARGRVALLGDAAHPMLPYLAQGAGMAMEDAAVLASQLSKAGPESVEAALAAYADLRWARCARVQSTARRNGRIFHARGAVRWGRDAAMAVLGEKLLDQPWLYGGP